MTPVEAGMARADNRIYLDYAATTPVDQSVVEAMKPYQNEIFGNPASIHSFGQEARAAVEQAREDIAWHIGANPDEIIFTGGGTESNNLAIQGAAYKHGKRGSHIVTSAIEHHSVLNCCRFLEHAGFRVTYVGVDEDGLVDPDDVKRAMEDDTILVSIMHANNEIGTIQPIGEIGEIASERGVLFHVDAVQSFGHLPINIGALKIDLLSASAHKLYGPKGVGILFVRRKAIRPLVHGGDQELGLRPSTHNVPAIVGFAEAVRIAQEVMGKEAEKIAMLRDALIEGILEKIEGAVLNGHPKKRLHNNVNVSFEYIDGESLLVGLDMAGIACSTGSACSFATLEPSHVLLALGVELGAVQSAVRFSLGRYTTKIEINQVLDILSGIIRRMRETSPFYRWRHG